MHRQRVAAAGAGREAGWVALAALVIVVAAASWIGLRGQTPEAAALAPYQIDARTALTPAEQGIFADLRLVALELDRTAPLPGPDELGAEGLPPFVADASWRARGGHRWHAVDGGYVGLSAYAEVAASMVLRLEGEGAEVWLKPTHTPPAGLDEATLIAEGWKQAVTSFSAGVTR
ncbi:DUF6162 family protein [Rhodospirillum rubrum]|uniref:Uncharacterized protein n=1 Tax=Rhodospirillum rubrum (strain ATCC 11170 / ATH 1.1.1 / DSM 467 / LMG 4362 / NCIMB 8255 / S1) TaxID=269796 RepID=Q2RRQ4_RHORT|nr:DUF6162 family protein [Rhodospirillum rubrum]ABC23191.1 conserved hypothetical protein [Rhodospirillum rubrum ATCC 11170]AEO48922.1 hypothetical protein F11_12290 [Rhodospirillum rubrum F11]MBK5954831.1 hypothetical protein [Rhodospirillum rubrum]QXG79170.1 hypothetical protein KUL73_12360 [Rhodospirillum rubrum]HAQ01129.1 hypothetical protein [Rhodospirillum rubrum]